MIDFLSTNIIGITRITIRRRDSFLLGTYAGLRQVVLNKIYVTTVFGDFRVSPIVKVVENYEHLNMFLVYIKLIKR